MRAPQELRDMLTQFWEANKHLQKLESSNAILNHFETPTTMVSLDDEELHVLGSGNKIIQAIWDATRPLVSEWTGQKLLGTSVYGIRVYKEGSVLLPHVDDLPLVCSAIINVAQSVEEPWPLEVYGRDGMAVNITMSPGDIVLYESHSLIHGRPFPLMGKYYSNVFIHFEPQQEENAVFQPPYFVPGTQKELVDLYYTQGRAGTNGYSGEVAREVVEKLDDWSSDEEDWAPAHYAAYRGDTEALKKYLKEQKVKVNERDDDGWTLLAYAAHSGHVKTVRFLVESGANVDIIIFEDEDNGEEVTAHEIARRNWGDDSEIVRFLSSAN